MSRTACACRASLIPKDEDVGLGDAIKRVTCAMGIKPCRGCEKRGLLR
jgi:hypothetical protein